MARIRTIKPEFCTSEQVAECSPTARLLFILMWPFCDDNGVHPDKAKRIKMQCFPADPFTDAEIKALIGELLAAGLLARFEAEGASFLHVTGWHKHQKIDKPSARFPLPPTLRDEGAAHGRRPLGEASPPEGKGTESKGKESRRLLTEKPHGSEDDPAGIVVASFLRLRSDFWPNDSRVPACDVTLFAVAGQYLKQGATPDLCAQVFERVMRQKRERGEGPPGELRFCRATLESEVGKLKAIGGMTPAGGDVAEAGDRKWRDRLAGFRDRAFWVGTWGPRPYEPGCLAPAALVCDMLAKPASPKLKVVAA